ncbi:MAG: helix-turn-helix domain-containing protein [Clostridia bacterium]|nr:helix-turn-helix domain-containing protein [Clostridia bacterium]
MYLAPATDERVCTLLPLHLITVGIHFKQSPVRRPDGASFHHIFFVEEGEGVFEVSDGIRCLGAGTAIFMRKNYPVAYYRKSDVFRTAFVTFDGPGVDALLQYFRMEDFACLSSERVLPMIRNCFYSAQKGASPEVLSQQVYDLAVTFFRQLCEGQKTSTMLAAKRVIEEAYCGDLSVSDIAGATGVSESLIYRLFRDEEGTTPVDYLRRVRISRAKQLLIEEPELPISAVASRCGFSDCAYFCKVFKRQTNMTPKAYRTAFAL